MSKETPTTMTLQCMTGKGLAKFLEDKTLTVNGLPYLNSNEVMKEIAVRLEHADRLKEIANGWNGSKDSMSMVFVLNDIIPTHWVGTGHLLAQWLKPMVLGTGLIDAAHWPEVESRVKALKIFNSDNNNLPAVFMRHNVELTITNTLEISITIKEKPKMPLGQMAPFTPNIMPGNPPGYFGPGTLFNRNNVFDYYSNIGPGIGAFGDNTVYQPQVKTGEPVSLTGGHPFPFGLIKVPVEIGSRPGRYLNAFAMMVLNNLPGFAESGDLGKSMIAYFNGKSGTREAWPDAYSLNKVLDEVLKRRNSKELLASMEHNNVVIVLFNHGSTVGASIFLEPFPYMFVPGMAPDASMTAEGECINTQINTASFNAQAYNRVNKSITRGEVKPFMIYLVDKGDADTYLGPLCEAAAYMVLNLLPELESTRNLKTSLIAYFEQEENENWPHELLGDFDDMVAHILESTGGIDNIINNFERGNVVVIMYPKGTSQAPARVIVEPFTPRYPLF